MKIKIFYTKPSVMVREVDDKFFVLTAEGGWGALSRDDREAITDELCKVVEAMLDDESVLTCVETVEDEVLIDL